MGYKIDYKQSALKYLRKMPLKMQSRLKVAIMGLSENPMGADTMKLEKDETKRRLRIGDYRIIYKIDKDNGRVIVVKIAPRGDAYKG